MYICLCIIVYTNDHKITKIKQNSLSKIIFNNWTTRFNNFCNWLLRKEFDNSQIRKFRKLLKCSELLQSFNTKNIYLRYFFFHLVITVRRNSYPLAYFRRGSLAISNVIYPPSETGRCSFLIFAIKGNVE